MPDFNQYSPETPFTPSIFSKINVKDSFVAIPDFPKLDDIPDIEGVGFIGQGGGGLFGPNPFDKYKGLVSPGPAASTDYWSNRKFSSQVTNTDAFKDIGFLIGRDNEDLFAKKGKGFLTATFDAGISLLEKVGLSAYSTIGTIGGLVGIGNKSGEYNSGNKFADWIAGASDNGLTKWADEQRDLVENIYRPGYQEAEDRDKGFFKRMATDGDFWTTDVVDGAAFMLGGLSAAKYLKYLSPGTRIIRGLKGLQGLRYADEAAALAEDGLTGASKVSTASANTIIAEGGEALAAGATGGVGNVATNAASPFYKKISQALLKTADPKEVIDKGIITFVNTSSEAMQEAIGVKNDLIDKLSVETNSDGSFKYTPDEIKNIVSNNMTDVFTGNLLALTLSNIWETNLFYGKGKSLFSGRNAKNALISESTGLLSQAEIVKRTFGQKGLDYLKKAGEGIVTEGLWEENVQLAIQRINSELNNGDEGFFTKLGDYVGQTIRQTKDAFQGNDVEASTSIGLGGLMGGFMGVNGRFREIRQIENNIKNFNDTVGFIKATANTFIKKDAAGKPIVKNGKFVMDKGKLVDYLSSMNKTLNTTELFHALKDTKASDLTQIVQNDLFSRLVKGYADSGLIDTLIGNLDSQKNYSAEDLAFLGFDPNVNKAELSEKIDLFKEKAVAYKNIYDNIERNFVVKMRNDKAGAKARAMKDTMYYLSSRANYLTDMKNSYDGKKDLVTADPAAAGFSMDSDGIVDSLNELLAKARAAKNRLDILSNDQENAVPGTNGLPGMSSYSAVHVNNGTSLFIPRNSERGVVRSTGAATNINNQQGNYVDVEELQAANDYFESVKKEVEDYIKNNEDTIKGLYQDADGSYRYASNAKNNIASVSEAKKSRSISAELERAINATYNVYSRLSDPRFGEKYYDDVYGKRKTQLFKFYEGAKIAAVGDQKLLKYYEKQKTASDDLNDEGDETDLDTNSPADPGAQPTDFKKTKKAGKKTTAAKTEDVQKAKEEIRDLEQQKEAIQNQEEVTLEDEQEIEAIEAKIETLESAINTNYEDLTQDVVDESVNIKPEDKGTFKEVLSKIALFAKKVTRNDDGYLIDGETYKRVSEIINNTIPENVRPLLRGSIDAGNTVDMVVKAYFSTGLTTQFRESLNGKISAESIDKIEKSLDKIRTNLENKGIEIVASNVIVHDPVTKVAGEIDLLGVDKNGNFKIYEIEARRGRVWQKVLNKEGVGIKIADLTQDQLSAYRNLFANQYGVLPNEVGVLAPVSVDIDETTEGGFIKNLKVLPLMNIVPKSVLKINSFINRTLGVGAFKGYNIFGIYANTFFGSAQEKEKAKFGFIARNIAASEIVGKVTMKIKDAEQAFQDVFAAQQAILNNDSVFSKPGKVTFDLNDVKRPNGAMGTQGVSEIQANDFLKSLGINVSKVDSFRDLIDYLKSNPTDLQKVIEFTEKNPIKITELPDGTFHIEDGHHRATLLYYSGVEQVPAIIKDAGKYNPKYKNKSNTVDGRLTKHPDAPNLYALRGNKEIGVYYEDQLAGYMSPVPALAYKKEDGSFAILDEKTDLDTYVATTGNSAKSYPDFINTVVAYKAIQQKLMDRLNKSNGEVNLSNAELQKMFDISVNYGRLDYAKAEDRPQLKDLSMRGVKVGPNQVVTVVHLDADDSVQIIMDKAGKGKKGYTRFLEVDKWANNSIPFIKSALETKEGKKRSNYVAVVELPDGTFIPISLKLNPGTTINPDSEYVADLGSKFNAAVTDKVFVSPAIQLSAKGVNVTTSMSLDAALFSEVFTGEDIESLEKLGLEPDQTISETATEKVNNFLSTLSEDQIVSLEGSELDTADKIMDAYYNAEGYSNIDDFIDNIKNCKL